MFISPTTLTTTTTIFLLFLLFPLISPTDPVVDVALSKPVWANLTCGFTGSERFFSQLFTGTQSFENLAVCANTSVYPASNINDGTDQTWWQSTSRLSFIGAGFGLQGKPDAIIHIDLQQEFQAEIISVHFGESLRPGRMIFYKQTTTGPMVQWFYRVTSAMDCQNLYSLPVSPLPTQPDSKPCTPYAGPAILEERVEFDFSRTPAPMKEWNKLKAIRIEFYNIDLTLGVSSGSNEFQHYTVRAVNVFAKCSCNGQLLDCVVNNGTNKYECVCGGNTKGEFCQLCHPLYNNQPYQFGKPCQKCNCNNQSESCIYDKERLAGVCDACQNFTSGINCETCNDGYYRPTAVLATDPNPCLACVCTGPFTTGQCLKTTEPVLNPGMNPGDCICKPNVVGQLCDRCQDGYYDISVTGCRDCSCQPNGTKASSKSCDSLGQCSCKQYTMGTRCDQCMDGYFNLAPSTPDGCIACNCDPGGSVSEKCDKVSGGCSCRLGIEGKTCDKPTTGYYYPEFHHFSAEMEDLNSPWQKALPDYSGFGYVSPLNQIPVSTTIDLTGISQINPRTFRIVLRYFSSVDVTGTLGIGSNSAISETMPFKVDACSGGGQWCFVPSQQLTLTPGTSVKVQFIFPAIPDNAKLSLDRVSAVPSPFFNASDILGTLENSDFLTKCNVLINNPNSNAVLRDECSKYTFTISTSILDGGLLCSCNGVGANSTESCNPNGGQCFCRPFVTGRSCDRCMAKYYSLSTTGCSQCNCSTTSYDMCDPITGVCLCPPGAEGADCSTCQLNYYDWDRVKGCLSCGCNQMGSNNLACDTSTGTCSCKTGVMGIKCDQCMDGYWKLSFLGCGQCSCDAMGSVSNTCDKTTGACQCKANVQGVWCNTCKLNSFSMTSDSSDGCLKCSCMGVSSTCSPSNLINPSFSLNPPSSTAILVDKFGNPYDAIKPTVNDVNKMIDAVIPALADVYWAFPAVKGDILYLYGMRVSWDVLWTATDTSLPPVPPQNPAVIVLGKDGQQYIFQIANFTTGPAGQTFRLQTNLVLVNVDGYKLASITREQILLALSDVKALMMPAVYKPIQHQSSIGSIEFLLDPSLVENCLCPRGYEGRSCDRCSVGFRRVNVTTQGFLGNCAPCSCNDMASTCDSDTGECSNCQQFTTGFSCENCLHGRYRDPADGVNGRCRKCPCEGPRVQTNECAFVNDTLACLNCTTGYKETLCNVCEADYYGDLSVSLMNSCRPCLCNGFSTQCDLLGICQNCSDFTTGDSCESCVPGKYKDQVSLKCVDCNCNATGSSSVTCDPNNGQCSCKSGVTSRKCDQCDANFYAFSDTGCTECMCNVHGSSSLQCNDNGLCPCNNNTSSDKCDSCLAGYYGILNNKPCQLCACDPLGTNSTRLFECDLLTGECDCRLNVVGRRCEMCRPLYYSLTEILDCITCGQCETSLGEDIIAMDTNAKTQFLPSVTDLKTIHVQDQDLASEQGVLDLYCSSLGNCQTNDNLYDQFKDNVSMLTSEHWKSEAEAMNTQATSLDVVLQQLNNESLVLLETVQTLKQQADQIRRDYGSQMATSNSDISRLSANNESAFLLWQGAPYNGSTFVALPWTHAAMFNPERTWLNVLISQSNSLAAKSDALNLQLNELAQQTNTIQGSVQASQDLFTSTSSEVQQLNNTINDKILKLGTLSVNINNLINIKAIADSNFQRVRDIVFLTGASLQLSASSLIKCQQTHIQTINLIHGNWTTKPPVYDQTGFRGWNQGYFLVNQLLQTSQAKLSDSQTRITPAEQQAGVLANKAAAISSAYDTVKARGQTAVDVIQKFEGVIKSLEEAIAQSASLNVTLQTLLNYMKSVPVPELLSQSTQVLSTANQLKSSIDSVINTTNPEDLSNQLDVAKSQFQGSVGQWSNIDNNLEAFNKEYQDLQNFVNALTPKLDSDFDNGVIKGEVVKGMINGVNAQHNNFVSGLDGIALEIDTISNSVTQSYATQNTLAANISNFRVQLDQAAKTSLTTTNATQSTISSLRSGLEEKFSQADEMLRKIQAQIASMEHPVFFPSNTFEQAANPDVDKDPLYSSISLQFMFSQSARGVLFFVENNLSNEKLLLQLLNSTVCFAVGNLQINEMVCNYAQLNAREWYKVYATRYGMDLKLTVIRHSTGGAVAVSTRSSLTSVLKVTLNSPVYIGGLALNAKNIQKVYDTGVGFNGCIYKVTFNGAPIPVWQNILKSDSSATCCKKPPATNFEALITPCITFYGFGYVIYNPSPSFNINPEAQIYLQFRTFMPQGVLMMVSSFASQDYYGVFVQNERIVFSIFSQNVVVSLTSDLTYVNGQWYQLTVTHTTTKISLRLDSGEENPVNMEFKEASGLINLSSLNNAPYIIGSQHPTYGRGPVRESFSGHVKDLKHTTESSSVPIVSLLTVNASLNVDLKSCLAKVVKGLNLLPSAYVTVVPSVSTIQTIDFTFITTQLSGILVYTPLEQTPSSLNTFLYIALYNGDIFMLFNQGGGVQPATRTRNLQLADARKHRVSLHFGFVNSPRMKVDNLETHVGAVSMNANMRLRENKVYVGGAPSSISLDTNVIPVDESFVGGIEQMKINDVEVPFMDNGVVNSLNSKKVDLSGIMLSRQVAEPPCNPCPAAPSTLSCIKSAQSISNYDQDTFNFGDQTQSYLQYSIAGQENVLVHGFVFQLKFRSLQPDGLMVYIANSPTVFLTDFYAIYLHKGYINAVLMNANIQKSVVSKKTYYDGNWHSLSVFRVGDFMAILVEDSYDYNNNNQDSSVRLPMTNFVINSPLYVGGIPLNISAFPSSIPIGKTAFKGCIASFSIQSSNYNAIDLDTSKIMKRVGVGLCMVGKQLGMFIASSNSYVRASDAYNPSTVYNLVPSFSIAITFKTSSQDGVLMVAWSSATSFVALSLVSGEFHLILGSPTQPLVFITTAFNSAFDVCNNLFHTLKMSIQTTSVTLEVDSTYKQSKEFNGFVFSPPLSVPIYLGGVKDPTWSIPNLFSGNSLSGCIQKCVINDLLIYITQSPDLRNALAGCN